jgi:catechol 2,3-dioxygenase-like lactoylglutathione lyase family enzyme
MKSRIEVLTLAVDDLPRSLAFYREGLGQARRLADGRYAS